MLFLLIPAFLIFLVVKCYRKCIPEERVSLKGKHVVVTGGSSGIGQAFAVLAAKRGAHVTIMARNIDKLTEAQKIIQSFAVDPEQQITKASVDVANSEDIENNLHEAEAIVGPIFMLVNCAGVAIMTEIENFTDQQIKSLVDTNFLGTLYAIKAMVPKFKEREQGIFILTSSGAGFMGLYGSSVYSACKFALRGLAESLYMEVKPYNISVTLALPPDTDTPGYEIENKTKPKETKLISASAGFFQPEVVAQKMLEDALNKKFFSHVGFESWLLANLCVGMAPFRSIFDIILEAAVLGPIRLISGFYISSFQKICMRCFFEKTSKQA